jgi:hypothetical protein
MRCGLSGTENLMTKLPARKQRPSRLEQSASINLCDLILKVNTIVTILSKSWPFAKTMSPRFWRSMGRNLHMYRTVKLSRFRQFFF